MAVLLLLVQAFLYKNIKSRVFEKVNTQSEQLNFFDLATACFASQDFSLRDDWAKREERLKQHRVLQTVKETDYIACVALVATYHQRQQAIAAGTPTQQLPAVACSREEVLDLSLADYQKYADQVVVGYNCRLTTRKQHGFCMDKKSKRLRICP